MAVVADLSGNFPISLPMGVDRQYADVNRVVAGSPFGTVTPAYANEIVQDSTTGSLYIAMSQLNTSWTNAGSV